MTDEKTDLDGLVKHPGWLRLVDYARKEWRETYPAKVKLAITTAKANHEDIASAVAAVDAAADAINQLLTWPAERLQRLQQAREPVMTQFRGGYDPTSAR